MAVIMLVSMTAQAQSSRIMVAFAQSDGDIELDPPGGGGGGYLEQPHRICTMDLTDADPESTLLCLEQEDPGVDDTAPVWSPSDSQIAFASERWDGGSTDYDIWVVNSDLSGTPENRTDTDQTIPDKYPTWGPASLP